MQLHTIKKQKGKIEAKTRVGRGGKRGKTCGHGHKGQKQHGRHGIRPEMRDFIKKLTNLRCFCKNRDRTVNSDKEQAQIVNLSQLTVFKSGDIISPKTLVEANLVEFTGGKLPKVKILAGKGELKSKLIVEKCLVSNSVKDLIQKAGGEVK